MTNATLRTAMVLVSALGMTAMMGSRGGCVVQADDCPDLYVACPNLECEQGFQVNKDGCAICACVGDVEPDGCLSDADCGRGQHCEVQISCVSQPCSDEMGYLCDDGQATSTCEAAEDGVCVDDPMPNTCVSDRDCQSYEFCIDGLCRPELPPPAECYEDRDCPEGMACDFTGLVDPETDPDPYPQGGVCVPVEPPPAECYSDRDCPDDMFCALMDCAQEMDCGAGGVCLPRDPDPNPNGCSNLDERECIAAPGCDPSYMGLGCACPGCAEGEDCPPCDCPDPADAEYFVECVPVDPCQGLDRDACEASPLCEALEYPMGMPCACDCPADGADCVCEDCEETMGWACVAIQPPPPPPAECHEDRDCPDGTFCAFFNCDDASNCGDMGGQCMPNEVPPPVECREDADCGEGFFCMTCPPDPDCPECDVCGPAVCLPVETTRPMSCQVSEDCPEGMRCSDGICL